MKRTLALTWCLLALGAEAGRRPARTRGAGGRQLQKSADAVSSSSSPANSWDLKPSPDTSADPAAPPSQSIESRQYYQPQGGYGDYPGQGGSPGAGPTGGYPGQGGSPGAGPTGGYPGQGGSPGAGPTGGYPGQGGSPGAGPTGGYPGQGGSPGASGGQEGPANPSENEIPRPPPGKPKPQRPPGCLGDRGQFPSPKSCSHYLNCWDETVVEQQCPGGLLFNERKQYCDFDYNVKCGNRPKPTPKPSLPSDSKRCPDPSGRYRSATNCSEFFVCVNGNPVKFSCPEGLVYSDETQICDYPGKVDCKGTATPRPIPSTTTTPAPTQRPPTSGYPPRPPPGYPQPPPGGYPQYPPPSVPQPITSHPLPPSTESPDPNPPYQPGQPELPAPFYPYASPSALRVKPEFWQQRQAALQSELEQELQAQKQLPGGYPQNPPPSVPQPPITSPPLPPSTESPNPNPPYQPGQPELPAPLYPYASQSALRVKPEFWQQRQAAPQSELEQELQAQKQLPGGYPQNPPPSVPQPPITSPPLPPSTESPNPNPPYQPGQPELPAPLYPYASQSALRVKPDFWQQRQAAPQSELEQELQAQKQLPGGYPQNPPPSVPQPPITSPPLPPSTESPNPNPPYQPGQPELPAPLYPYASQSALRVKPEFWQQRQAAPQSELEQELQAQKQLPGGYPQNPPPSVPQPPITSPPLPPSTESPNPNPPYQPGQPELPAPLYPYASQSALRVKPDFWQQRQAAPQSELEQELQAQKQLPGGYPQNPPPSVPQPPITSPPLPPSTESPNPNPPYQPGQPELPAPLYPYASQSALRVKPEFWQQRQAAPQSELEQELQAQKQLPGGYPQNPPPSVPQPPITSPPLPPSTESPNPNPPYQPGQPELPAPLYPYASQSALRVKPEFLQQRQAAPQSELEQELQAQKEPGQTEETLDSSTIVNPWEVIHTIPQEFAKAPCDNGEVHRLTEACTSVVVCRNQRPQLINCQTDYAYDKPSDSCKHYKIAKC